MKPITPDWPAPSHVRACTTVRGFWGGQSSRLPEEREKLVALLKLPEVPVFLNQTHSNIALEATPEHRDQTGDGSFTRKANRICVAMTADCLPVLACNPEGTVVAAAHAGWRGLAGGIVENTLTAMNEPFANLLIWLGPAIGPHKFEVGDDVYHAFTQNDPAAAIGFKAQPNHKWLADIYTLARHRLVKLGINPAHIYGGTHCTHTESEAFYSFRREKDQAGRMASLIWIQNH
jgi:YfiH family protein